MTYLDSASSVERTLACPAWLVLPHVESTSEGAERGTAFHAYARRILRGLPKAQALELVPKSILPMCDQLDIRTALSDLREVRAERAYAINLAESDPARMLREFGELEDRAYPELEPSWIPGTVDFEGVRAFDGIPESGDWKTGDPPRADESIQLRIYAAYAMIRTGAPEGGGRIVHVHRTGRVRVSRAEWSWFDIEDLLAEIREAHARAETMRAEYKRGHLPVVRTGEHCKYCPAFQACPGQVALVRTMAGDIDSIEERLLALTPAQAGIAYARMKDIQALLDRIKEPMRVLAIRNVNLTLPRGQETYVVTFPQERLDKEALLALAERLGATREEIDACYTEATQTQVRVRAVKKKALRA